MTRNFHRLDLERAIVVDVCSAEAALERRVACQPLRSADAEAWRAGYGDTLENEIEYEEDVNKHIEHFHQDELLVLEADVHGHGQRGVDDQNCVRQRACVDEQHAATDTPSPVECPDMRARARHPALYSGRAVCAHTRSIGVLMRTQSQATRAGWVGSTILMRQAIVSRPSHSRSSAAVSFCGLTLGDLNTESTVLNRGEFMLTLSPFSPPQAMNACNDEQQTLCTREREVTSCVEYS